MRRPGPSFAIVLLVALGLFRAAAAESTAPPERTVALRGTLGTYAGLPRLPDHRANLPLLLQQLAELGANTYNFLIWHEAGDWEDLQRFLPLARAQNLRVWVTLVPPSESPPKAKFYSEPYRLDYERWAQELAQLSLVHPNLIAWSIDDFAHNLTVFTPAKTGKMLAAARSINPRLAFVPCLYFRQLTPKFAAAYGELLDGVLFPYRNESVKADLKDPDQVAAEIARVRQLFRPGLPVIIDVYATRHSSLGASTPAYVTAVLEAGRTHGDGVIVYCHHNPETEAEKYAATRAAFAPRR